MHYCSSKYRYISYTFSILLVIGIVWYTQYYLPRHRAVAAKETYGIGVIKDIKFVPKHEETATYTTYRGSGKYRMPVHNKRTYTLPDSYILNIYIKEINKEDKYQDFNILKVKKYNIGDQVKVKYKVEDAFFKTMVVISDVERIP